MIEPTKFDWGENVLSFLGGIVTTMLTLFTWFSHKLSGVHKRIDEVEAKASLYAVHIGVQQAQHLANQQRLDGIEDGLKAINAKQDRQTEILIDLSSR